MMNIAMAMLRKQASTLLAAIVEMMTPLSHPKAEKAHLIISSPKHSHHAFQTYLGDRTRLSHVCLCGPITEANLAELAQNIALCRKLPRQLEFHLYITDEFNPVREMLFKSGVGAEQIKWPQLLPSVVSIDGRDYLFNERIFPFPGPAAINVQTSAENLGIISRAFASKGIRHAAAWGTLLGIIRDKALIPWDTDVDLIVSAEQKNAILSCSWELDGLGLHLSRMLPDLFTYIRDGDQVDVYFFERRERNAQVYFKYQEFEIPEAMFLQTEPMEFSGMTIEVPREARTLLESWYGEDWQRPIRGWTTDVPIKRLI